MKLKIEKDRNDSLSIEHKEEIRIFHKSMDLLISSILNNNMNIKMEKAVYQSNIRKKYVFSISP